MDDMAARLAIIEKKIETLIEWQHAIDTWRDELERNTETMKDMVELFKRIESSLWLFVKIGNGVKWLVQLGIAFAALWAATKLGLKWMVE
jgi:hypothetical protein